MLLAGQTAIREVIAFPLNQQGQDLMMNAPSAVREKQLKETAHPRRRPDQGLNGKGRADRSSSEARRVATSIGLRSASSEMTMSARPRHFRVDVPRKPFIILDELADLLVGEDRGGSVTPRDGAVTQLVFLFQPPF